MVIKRKKDCLNKEKRGCPRAASFVLNGTDFLYKTGKSVYKQAVSRYNESRKERDFWKFMETKIVEIHQNRLSQSILREAGQRIKNGELVAFPTETVYGLGGDALNPESARKIYAAKGRPSDNPLIVHICRLEDLSLLAREIPESAWLLAKHFWPGALTMILKKAEGVPKETTGGLDTVAVRMPSDPVALELIRQAGGFVAAPSANCSGRPSPTCSKYVIEDMNGRIEMILAGEDSCIGLESTIIDLTVPIPMILRPGCITPAMLESVLEKVEADPNILGKEGEEPPRAPGMRYRHYAPRGELTIVRGKPREVTKRINELTDISRSRGKKTGVICVEETRSFYRADSIKSLGRRQDGQEIAKQLYRILREFDEEKTEVIFSESFSEYGIGQAIMNRLLKAAGHRVIQL